MTKQLDALEEDLLGDLGQDDHSLYEFFEFVRLHRPEYDDGAVFKTGRALVADWVSRGWLELSEDRGTWGDAQTISDLLPILDSRGTEATRYFDNSPWLRLGANAYADVDWLHRC
jgi:hypothetical protein